MPKKSVKKKSRKNNNNSNNRKSKKRQSYRKQWFCFGTMTILSNHKRTAEKYLNQLDDAGVKPEEIKIYQGKGQGAGGYSRINICYYAHKKLIDSTY